MNQRDATVAVIAFIREQFSPDDLTREVERALKVLEKRAEVLRLRNERRLVPIPDDLMSERLLLNRRSIVASLNGDACACWAKKRSRESLCVRCFNRLEPGTRKALRLSFGHGYEHAYCRALRELGHKVVGERDCRPDCPTCHGKGHISIDTQGGHYMAPCPNFAPLALAGGNHD